MSDAEEVSKLKQAMWQKRFVIMARRVVRPDLIPANQLAHYRWVIEQEKAGRIFLSGPVFDAGGQPLGGMTLLAVTDLEEAAALAETDPFITSGAMSYELRIWQLNEGRITVTVDLSDMTGRPETGS